ncbi:MAG: ATP synthase F0 subunit B [Eubacteriales bacterium]|nr:ATP synthase F0 subunit B [Eubacteriales bacterium]
MIHTLVSMHIIALEQSLDLFSRENLASYLATAILALVNLGLTYWIIKRILFKPIQKLLEARREKIESDLAAAELHKQEAEALEAQYHSKLQAAHDEASSIIRDAQKLADLQASQRRQEVEEELDLWRKRVHEELSVDEARQELARKQAVVDISTEMLRQIFKSQSDDSLLDEKIQAAEAEVRKQMSMKEAVRDEE